MKEGAVNRLGRVFSGSGSIRRRLFWLLGGFGLGTLLVVNLIWLPSTIREVQESQAELQRAVVWGVRDQIHLFLEDKEEALRAQAMLFRPSFLENDREALRLLAHRFLQRELPFEEVGILDGQGKERLRLSRTLVITDRDLRDRSTSSLFREGLRQEIYWGPVVTTETSDLRVTLAVPLRGSGAVQVGVVFGVLNLKSLWDLTEELKLIFGGHGRAYVVDGTGRLIAADDPNLVLKQLSFANRPLVEQLRHPASPGHLSFVRGSYTNEYGVTVTATGLSLPPGWGVVVEQPQSVLYAAVWQKLWFFFGLSVVGLLVSLSLAHFLSRRFTTPITRLGEGVAKIGSGHLDHRVVIETGDEIEELARQFNQMTDQLHASLQDLERKVEEAEWRAREISTLHELGTKLVSTLDLSAVLEAIASSAIALIGAQRCAVFELDPRDQRLHMQASRGMQPDQPFVPMKLGQGAAGSAALRREPVFSPDVESQPLPMYDEVWEEAGMTLREVIRRRGYRAILAVPLISKETVLGAICIYWDKIHAYDGREVQLLTALAQQAAVTIENARLFEETRARAREQEALNAIATAVSRSLHLHEIFQIALDKVLEITGRERGSIRVKDSVTGEIRLVAHRGISEEAVEAIRANRSQGQKLIEVFETGQPFVLHDPAGTQARPSGLYEWVSSIVWVPLKARGKVVGILGTGTRRPIPITPREVELLTAVGNVIGVALENARLYEETERRRREAEELARVAQTLTESLDMTAVGERIVTSVRGLFGVKGAMLRLLQPDGSLRILASSREVLFGGDVLPPGAGLAGLAVAKGRPYWSADVLKEPEVGLTDQMRDYQLLSGNRSMIAMPLRVHEKIIGSLGLSDETGRVYSDGEVALLQTFADQAALALENARLFDETEQRAQEQVALNAISTAMSQSLQIEAVLQIALEKTLEVTGREVGFIRLKDAPSEGLRLAVHRGVSESYASALAEADHFGGKAAEVLATGQLLVVNDPSPEDLLETTWQEGIRTTAWVPLQAKGQVVGILNVASRSAKPFEPRELDLLRGIGNIIGTAVANARLYEETRQRTEKLHAMTELTRLMTSSLSVQEIFDFVVRSVATLLNAKVVRLWAEDRASGGFVARASWGIEPAALEHHSLTPIIRPGEGVIGGVIESKTAEFLLDVREEPRFLNRHLIQTQGLISYAAVPIVMGERVLGVLAIMMDRVHEFSEEEKDLLKSFADQAAVAVEKARLYEGLAHKGQRLGVLNRLSLVLTATLDQRAVFEAVTRAAVELFGDAAASLWVLDPQGRELSVASDAGHRNPGGRARTTLALGEGMVGRVAQTRQPLVVDDIDHYPGFVNRAHAQAEGIRVLMAVPLLYGDLCLGALSVSRRSLEAFRPEDVEMLSALASHAAIAIQNARLFQDVQQRVQEISGLHEIGTKLVSSLDLSAVLEAITSSAVTLIDAQRCAVFELDPRDERLHVRASRGMRPDQPFVPLKLGQGAAGSAALKREPVFSPDVYAQPLPMYDEMLEEAGITLREAVQRRGYRAILAVPIVSKDAALGAICVYWDEIHPYEEREVKLLAAVAHQAAVAIENARLFEETRQRARELAIFHTAASTFNQSMDLKRTLEMVLDALLKFVSADAASLRLLNAEADQMEFAVNRGFSEAYLEHRGRLRDIGKAARHVLSTGDAVISGDLEHDPLLQGGLQVRAGFRSAIYIPIKVKDEIVGILNLASRQPGRFDRREVDILVSIGHQLGLALENVRLLQETTRRAQEQEALNAIAAAVTQSLDLDELFTIALDKVLEVTGREQGYIRLKDPVTGEIKLGAHRGISEEHIEALIHRRTPGGKSDQVFDSGMPLVVNDPEGTFLKEGTRREGFYSMAWIPLKARGKVVGILNVATRRRISFTPQEVELLQAIGNMIGVALENARLFEESRRLVGELKAMTHELSAKNKELDTFVYTVSHDLKAPLVTLQGMAELLLEGYESQLDEQAHHYVTRLKANAQQMERLILDLLALSRIGREGRPPEAVSLDQVVEDLLLEWGARIRERGVTVSRCELPTLWGVRTQIEQVMGNLLSNAIKYLGENPAPRIEIGAKNGPGELVECYVQDNGIGIDPAYHEKVFEIFQRLQDTEVEGTGVGLAIVKKIVEGAGGRSWVESAKGEGATFRFAWPKAPEGNERGGKRS